MARADSSVLTRCGYVLANVTSPRWQERAFAFNVDGPGPNLGAWWDGIHLQRRFVRIIPSLAMAAEVHGLGARPVRLHAVTLGLHLASALLVYFVLRGVTARWWPAVIGSSLFAVHPAAKEIIAWWCCQPIAFAALFGLAAAASLIRYREAGRQRWLLLSWVLSAAAVTSYEAALAVPLLLILLGFFPLPTSGGERPTGRPIRIRATIGFASGWLLLLSLTVVSRRGVTAPDTSFRPTATEAWCTGRVDLANYFLKTVGLTDPHGPANYWFFNRFGEGAGMTVAAVLLLLAMGWAWRSRMGRFGLLVFVALLAPPYLIRTFVGALNNPTLRQLYLPMVGVAVIAASVTARFRAAKYVVLSLCAGALPFNWISAGSRPSLDHPDISTRLRTMLRDTTADTPVIISGTFNGVPGGCSYWLAFDWPRRTQWMLIPPSNDHGSVDVRMEDERSIRATTPAGFDLPVGPRAHAQVSCEPGFFSPYGTRADILPPPLIQQGVQEIDGARVEVVARTDADITSLRFRLPQPLTHYVFLDVHGCEHIRRLRF